MPCELWSCPKTKMTFMMMRGGTISNKSMLFMDELCAWIKKEGIANVHVLSATMNNPIRNERPSCRNIPNLFAYVNNHVYKSTPNYYEHHGIKKFGHWLEDNEAKIKPH
jgi:hypothetical protein